MTTSDTTKIAVLNQKVDDLRDDIREVKGLVSNKLATTQYVDDKIGPIKKLVYWYLGILGGIVVGSVLAVAGLVLNSKK